MWRMQVMRLLPIVIYMAVHIIYSSILCHDTAFKCNLLMGQTPKTLLRQLHRKRKLFFAESITNPSLHVFDVEAVAQIAHQHHIPLIIDNTFSPYMFQPIKWGADVVVHSATKWIGGHGTTIGGVVVDGGRFDWNHDRFPGFTEP